MLLRGGGAGLGGIAIIVGLLYFTGAGSWMLDRMQQLPNQCSSALSMAGPSMANPVCNGMGKGISAITQLSTSVGDMMRTIKSKFTGELPSGHIEGLNGLGSSLQQRFAGLTSPSDRLQNMMQSGPQQMGSGGSLSQQFQRAVDSFTIGQSYAQGGNAAQAVPWLQQGARQPQGFGLMSQLSLANLYRTGGNGIAADPVQSQAYYGLASGSLSQLSQSNTPQAQQILRSLNASPQQLQQEIAQTVASMKSSIHR